MSDIIFKDIPGYGGLYQVSNYGDVRSFFGKSVRMLKNGSTPDGYARINLYLNGKYKTFRVHRLVLLAFKGSSSLECNHLDGNRGNNYIENLEYCTRGDNVRHSFNSLGRIGTYAKTKPWKGRFGKEHNCSKKINQYNMNGSFVKTWGSIIEAAKGIGVHQSGISKCCNGIAKSAGGFIFKFFNQL